MDLGIAGSVALVTGGTSGVGLAVVELLLDEGATVHTCSRDRARADEALAPVRSRHGDRVVWHEVDVRQRDQVDALVSVVGSTAGRLDLLVNNAGQSRVATFAQTSDEDWEDELALKFRPVIATVRACRGLLAASPHGAIVNVNSIIGRQPEPHLVATSAARAGLLNLSRSLAGELAPEGIRVNSVTLGVIDTGQWRRRFAQADTALDYDAWARGIAEDRGIPLGRFGTAMEVAAAIVMLLSPRLSYVTGSALEVGGGVHRYV
jgi:NAD(P)-dependent dehydrogenase (short-subunit alcohol dehydrogenase family)